MPTPWTAEIEFTADDATRLIEQQFPTLAPAEVTLQGVGWDNFAFLYGSPDGSRRAPPSPVITKHVAVAIATCFPSCTSSP